jgi:hypothetical protein
MLDALTLAVHFNPKSRTPTNTLKQIGDIPYQGINKGIKYT